jgi:hypothetical protein
VADERQRSGEARSAVALVPSVDLFRHSLIPDARRSARPRDARIFVRERQQRIAFGAAHAATSVLAKEKDDESKHEAQADRESEWDDRHGEKPRQAGSVGVRINEHGVGDGAEFTATRPVPLRRPCRPLCIYCRPTPRSLCRGQNRLDRQRERTGANLASHDRSKRRPRGVGSSKTWRTQGVALQPLAQEKHAAGERQARYGNDE